MNDLLSKTSVLNPSVVGKTKDKGLLTPNTKVDKARTDGFSKALEEKLKTGLTEASVAKSGGIKFSNHAVERMQNRGIRFTEDQLDRITNAITKAAQKGAKETLVLTDESALIVSVKNNTVVTVMDKEMLKENVFTNIDSTVVV